MEKEKINQFLLVNGKNFPETLQFQLRQQLEKVDETNESLILASDWKSPMTTFLLAFFTGAFGVDRFYLGDTGLGVAKLLTCGGVGIWSLIDWFTASGRAKKVNYAKLQTML